ncbi:MAG TPA: hypothetical protein VK913_02360 [Erythrobacter sp.]|nr:hypothetical protein [Erythrobacter sp.]
MTRPPFQQWTQQAQDASFTDTAEIRHRSAGFERTIHRRNMRENAAGWFGIALSISLCVFFAWAGEFAQSVAAAILAVGFFVVMRNLRGRASNLERRHEEPCIDHLKRQYRQQARALTSVASWYIGPLLPGFAAMQASITWSFAQSRGWEYALRDAIWPVAIIGIFLLGVIALNGWAARDLRRKLAALETLD